jgi:hypothetical protein
MYRVALRLRLSGRAMKLLRTGGKFADRHIRRHGKNAILYFVGYVAICAVFFFVSYKLVALLGLVLAFGHFTKAYDKWEHWFLGKRGELAVTRALNGLPDGYVLLNDLLLPRGRGNVDHFLIGPNGLFVIETKNFDTHVRCEDDRWFVNGNPVKSLSWQAKSNALAVWKNLQPLFSQHRAYLPFVEPLLVFVKHKRALDLNQPTVHVLREDELVGFICNYKPRSRSVRFSPELIRAMVHHLQLLQNDKADCVENSGEPPRTAKSARL